MQLRMFSPMYASTAASKYLLQASFSARDQMLHETQQKKENGTRVSTTLLLLYVFSGSYKTNHQIT